MRRQGMGRGIHYTAVIVLLYSATKSKEGDGATNHLFHISGLCGIIILKLGCDFLIPLDNAAKVIEY